MAPRPRWGTNQQYRRVGRWGLTSGRSCANNRMPFIDDDSVHSAPRQLRVEPSVFVAEVAPHDFPRSKIGDDHVSFRFGPSIAIDQRAPQHMPRPRRNISYAIHPEKSLALAEFLTWRGRILASRRCPPHFGRWWRSPALGLLGNHGPSGRPAVEILGRSSDAALPTVNLADHQEGTDGGT